MKPAYELWGWGRRWAAYSDLASAKAGADESAYAWPAHGPWRVIRDGRTVYTGCADTYALVRSLSPATDEQIERSFDAYR